MATAPIADPAISQCFASKIKEAIQHIAGIPQLANVQQFLYQMSDSACEAYAEQATDVLAAKALLKTDEVCRDSRPPDFIKILKNMQELLVLSCARSFKLDGLDTQGIPPALRDKFQIALGLAVLDNNALFSRLGNAKYNLFSQGHKFSKRRPKKEKVTVSEVQISRPNPQDDVPECEMGDRHEFSSEDSDDGNVRFERFPSPAKIEFASSCHSKWGIAKSFEQTKSAALAPRHRVHEVLEKIAEEFETDGKSMPDIDKYVMQVMDELQRQLPNTRTESIVRTWVELVAHKRRPQLDLTHYGLCDLLAAVERLLHSLEHSKPESEPIMLHCCEVLGTLTVHSPVLAEDVAHVVVSLMMRLTQNPKMQMAGIDSLWRLCWSRRMILGDTAPCQTPALEASAQKYIHIAVCQILQQASSEKLTRMAYEVLARIQPLPEVLRAVDVEAKWLKVILSEIFSVHQKCLEHDWSRTDPLHQDGAVEEHELIHRLRAQVSDMSDAAQSHIMPIVEEWIREGTEGDDNAGYWKPYRMVCAVVLFNNCSMVASTLFHDLDVGISNGYFAEDSITSALRALIHLMDLGLLDNTLARQIFERVRDSRFKPITASCHSAYIGALVTFPKLAIASSPNLADVIVNDIIDTAKYWLPKYKNQGVIHEAVWALNKICEGADTDLLKSWDTPLGELMGMIENDTFFQQMLEKPTSGNDVVEIFKQVRKLKQQLVLYISPCLPC